MSNLQTQRQYPFIGNIAESINQLDNMVDLNKVIDVIKQKQKSLRAGITAELRTNFMVGQTVSIKSKGKILTGTIKKINRSKCIVNIKSSLYNVPMSIMEIK
jgi:hypothetical protein